jgi:hypothetical protein
LAVNHCFDCRGRPRAGHVHICRMHKDTAANDLGKAS